MEIGVSIFVDTQAVNTIQEGLYQAFRNVFDEAFFHTFFEGYVFYTGEDVGFGHIIQNNSSSVRVQLAAIRAVSFVAVIFCRVVACSDNDTCFAFQLANRIGQNRNRHQFREDAYFDAVCSENASGFFCENIAVDTAVITDGNGIAFVGVIQVVSHSLSSLTNGVDVHTVSAHAQNTAKTCGTEFQALIEAFHDFFVVAFDAFQFSSKSRIFHFNGFPNVISVHVTHK